MTYSYPLPLNKSTAGLPYFSFAINNTIKDFNNKNGKTPSHEEMLKLLNKTINNVNTFHRKKRVY